MSVDLQTKPPAPLVRGFASVPHAMPAAASVAQTAESRQAERALVQVARNARRPIAPDAMEVATRLGAGVFATVLNDWPKTGARQALSPSEERSLIKELRALLHARIRGDNLQRLNTAVETTPMPSVGAITIQGEPRARLLSLKEGEARLRELASDLPIETWAGEVLKPSAMAACLGVARSTLAKWRDDGEVIAFKAGKVKHIYPREQFIEAAPVLGLKSLREIAPSDRALWLWLKTRSPQLSGEFPLDLLKRGQLDSVITACKVIFAS